MVEAVDEMHKRLKVSGREGYIFRVWYESESRDLAQSVLTRMLKLVIEDDKGRLERQRRRRTSSSNLNASTPRPTSRRRRPRSRRS